MTPLDESRKEVRSEKEGLLGPKTKNRIGAWNVRTMFETTKTAQVLSEMKRYSLEILGSHSESHWTGSGRQVLHDGSAILHSGHENTHTHGVEKESTLSLLVDRFHMTFPVQLTVELHTKVPVVSTT